MQMPPLVTCQHHPMSSRADLTFLQPLFDLANSMANPTGEFPTFGLAEVDEHSTMGKDDAMLGGYWESIIVAHGVGAAIDHLLTVQSMLTTGAGRADDVLITVSAPWTLLRGALEPLAVGLWVMDGKRNTRLERSLRVWHYDYAQQAAYRQNLRRKPVPDDPSSDSRGTIMDVAKTLNLRGQVIATELNYGDSVGHAGVAVGWKFRTAYARWQEASGFAHGRPWAVYNLADVSSAERIRGGYGIRATLDEARLAEFARLLLDVFNGVLDRYSERAVT
jgi:hypothetical protein